MSLSFSTSASAGSLWPLPAATANTPQIGPITVVAGEGSCGTNVSCLCKDTAFISTLTKKVEDVCSDEDVDKVVKLATDACKNEGVDVDIPVEDDDNDGGASEDDDKDGGARASTANLVMMAGMVGLAAQAVL